MPKFDFKTEDRILKALDALQHQEHPNITKTAREFEISRTTLNARFKGRGSFFTRPPTKLKLDNYQDKALCCYINTLDDLGVYPQPKMIENTANSLLRLAHTNPDTPPPIVGDKWLKRWLRRHPQYNQRRSRAIELDRKRAEDREGIQEWFKKAGKGHTVSWDCGG